MRNLNKIFYSLKYEKKDVPYERHLHKSLKTSCVIWDQFHFYDLFNISQKKNVVISFNCVIKKGNLKQYGIL